MEWYHVDSTDMIHLDVSTMQNNYSSNGNRVGGARGFNSRRPFGFPASAPTGANCTAVCHKMAPPIPFTRDPILGESTGLC